MTGKIDRTREVPLTVPDWCEWPDHRQVVEGIQGCDTDCPAMTVEGTCDLSPVRSGARRLST
jgi:hypothetical protein